MVGGAPDCWVCLSTASTAKFVRPHRAMTLLSCCVSTWTVAMAMADVPSYHPCPPLTTFEPLFCPVTPPLDKHYPSTNFKVYDLQMLSFIVYGLGFVNCRVYDLQVRTAESTE